MLFYKAFHLRVLGVPFYLRGPPIICSGSNDQRFASLDPFKLAGNYSQKSGNPISEILISKIFRGGPTTAPAPPNRLSCHGPDDEITRLNRNVTTTMNLVIVSSRVLYVLTNARTTPVDSPSCTLKHD